MELEEALSAVGELLEADGEEISIVVVGGASLNLLGLVERTTNDVDVIALALRGDRESIPHLTRPDPLPVPLTRAIATVARDFGLPGNWMNTDVALQWNSDLPPTLAADIVWRRYGGLTIGLVGRRTLIALKLFAAVDQGPQAVHFQDLLNLRPSREEVATARQWVATQDASEDFASQLEKAVQDLLSRIESL